MSARTATEWESENSEDMKRIGIRLPRFTGPLCLAVRNGFCCTRVKGHHGRHAASGTEFVISVWADR